ncbi:MAG: MBOAT family protein, partial [Deltaproteobacteria bacterium]|nr:MBOAT family protein [Deltaproteobacteria bacterium]
MLFTQVEFLIFFGVVLAFLAVVRHNRSRKIFLLAASYYFYAYWDWRFLGLLVFSTLVDFGVGQGLKRTQAGRSRKALLVASLVCNLGILGFFKYYNFFVESLTGLLSPLGLNLSTLPIILPIGISFYTFQKLSYTIDLYRGRIEACDDPFDFALFVGFFPQLVAGPIVRAAHLLPQFKARRNLSWDQAASGGRQFVLGFFKKVFIADRIAFGVDVVFENPAAFGPAAVWLAVLGFAVQIYCDFSGYSDMAIGAARMMGYDLPVNFRLPYLAVSPRDFWRRWHITLSTWLRDYLYIPLGGNRKGRGRTYLNLMLTMLLGGLWHGAGLTFVFWGAWHGLALAGDRFLRSVTDKEEAGRAGKVLGWLVTLLIVLVGWVFFRAESFSKAFIMLRQMFAPAGVQVSWLPPFAVFAVGLMILGHGLKEVRLASANGLETARWYAPAVVLAM